MGGDESTLESKIKIKDRFVIHSCMRAALNRLTLQPVKAELSLTKRYAHRLKFDPLGNILTVSGAKKRTLQFEVAVRVRLNLETIILIIKL